jgi:hypothetical protein
MKILGVIQPNTPRWLLQKELGELYDKITWVECHDWNKTPGGLDTGVVNAALIRENPEFVIVFGRIITDGISKCMETGEVFAMPAVPDLTAFEKRMDDLRDRLHRRMLPKPTTPEPPAQADESEDDVPF